MCNRFCVNIVMLCFMLGLSLDIWSYICGDCAHHREFSVLCNSEKGNLRVVFVDSGVKAIVAQYADCVDKPLKDSMLKITPEPMVELTSEARPVRRGGQKLIAKN